MDRISIKGTENLKKFIEGVSCQLVQILVTVDDFQSQKDYDEKFFTVDIAYPEYSGDYFEKVNELDTITPYQEKE